MRSVAVCEAEYEEERRGIIKCGVWAEDLTGGGTLGHPPAPANTLHSSKARTVGLSRARLDHVREILTASLSLSVIVNK